MTKPLGDAWAKFNRAKAHSHSLSRKISAWVKSQGNRPIFTMELSEDKKRGCLIIRIRRVKRLPRAWSLIAGDALFNFRASLDYVAWQLVQAGTNPNTSHPERVQWPIVAKEPDANGMFHDRLPGISPRHRALVEVCQPYKGEAGKLNPLVVLNEISRHDKHRKITVVSAAHKGFTIGGTLRHFTHERIETPGSEHFVPLKRGAELIRIIGKRTGDREPQIENIHFEGTTGIAFENGLWVLEAWAKIEDRIGNILANFDPLF
jgi:hypothetical protein